MPLPSPEVFPQAAAQTFKPLLSKRENGGVAGFGPDATQQQALKRDSLLSLPSTCQTTIPSLPSPQDVF